MMYDRNSGTSSNHCLMFNTGPTLSSIDYNSLVLNDEEKHLLLVGNHELSFINLENMGTLLENTMVDGMSVVLPRISEIHHHPLFDTCNVNRPVVQWNPLSPNQYAIAIDRIARIYAVDHGRIHETNAIIDSQHQRPISTIAYSPQDASQLLTGSLDGQIQVWDTRNCTTRSPASLKLSVSTPFTIRRIQWGSTGLDKTYQLAVQCDRSIRIYDIRRIDTTPFPSVDIEHPQRILSIDWTSETRSILSLSADQVLRIHSSYGQLIADSQTTNLSPNYVSNKIRSTKCDNLFISATRDNQSSSFGFVGWRWDNDNHIRPLNDRILSTTPSPIVDFCFVTKSRLLNGLHDLPLIRSHEENGNTFFLLTWCRDGQLCLVDMDTTFRQAWINYQHQHFQQQIQTLRGKNSFTSDSSISSNSTRTPANSSRQRLNRNSSSVLTMDVIRDESLDDLGDLEDDHCFEGMSTSPSNAMDSLSTDDESDSSVIPDRNNNTITEVSVANELNSLHDTYGPYITVEQKDERNRMCVVRCNTSIENFSSFQIYLILSRHYPIISQLFVRFKMSSINKNERFTSFQADIQTMFDQTSHENFYHGQLCLHRCLVKLRSLIDNYVKKEKHLSTLVSTSNALNKTRDHFRASTELDSSNGLNTSIGSHNGTTGNTSTRIYPGSSSSTRTTDSQLSGASFSSANRRTCGARFSGSTHLICFGRINSNPLNAVTPTEPNNMSRPPILSARSTSLTVSKSRENSSTDDHSNYRPPTTNNVQIQPNSMNQRLPHFSAPVRSSPSSLFTEHQRAPTSYRRSYGQINYPQSKVSVYDISILLPVSKKLADDYDIDFHNPMDMCEKNEQKTRKMAKEDLAHCWRLLGGLLSIQPNLQPDDPWFQTPIAQGLIKHLVGNYEIHGDIQSASMFLLAMSQSPYLKTRIQSQLVSEHELDPILYGYASLLHRWKHFYKRTQILSQIDHNCQSPAPLNAPSIIICAICLQPVLGQYFLCAACGHGGHLFHMHDWFQDELKHKYCPEKDCTCRCIFKQQELLLTNSLQMQQQPQQPQQLSGPPVITARTYLSRQSSGNIRS